jgi:TolB-like protein/Flp pilus assembly protein TadD
VLGRTLGRYEILSELGRGANGVVWKARHTLLPDRLVALKVLSESLWSSDQARRRFLQEAIAVSRLDHPGIATLYDAEEIDGQLYIAFKLIDGETVARQTAAGPLPVRRAVSIARDAAEALAHAHDQGVIHRDLSAGNVMVDRGGRGILVDFGLARSGQSVTQTTGVIVGTLPFMAPEVLRGDGADARSDIYGLGAVLYRMLTGRAPFEGGGVEELSYQILHGRPAPPSSLNPGVSAELDEVVLRALERDPRDRYGSAREMTRVLEGVLGEVGEELESTVVGTPGSRLFSSMRRALRRRSSRWLVGTGAAALIVSGGLAIAWTRGFRPGFLARVPVVAVLPARNASEDLEGSAYLGEAFGEDLVTRLGQIPRLRLLPWLTTQRFTDPSQRIEATGRELHADKLVVGTYRSDGERVRVTVALVDAKSGLQSWSQAYEERAEDLFALQQSVATGIAMHLRGNLTPQEREHLGAAASRSPEAYEYYLRGANNMNSQDSQQIAMAGPIFERAVELDPNLAVAWVGVGAVKGDLYFRGLGSRADLNAAEAAYRRALSIDRKLNSAKRGLMRVYWEREEPEAVLALGKRVHDETNDADALLSRAWAYTFGGLPDKAVPIFNRVLELDPGSQAAAWLRVVAESWSDRYALAAEHAKAYLRKYGEDPEMWTWLGVDLHSMGDKAQARLCLSRALELFGQDQSNMYSVLYALCLYRELGETARADSLLHSWNDIMDRRLRAYPDNARLREMKITLDVLSGVQGSSAMLISAWEKGLGVNGDITILGALSPSELRRACSAYRSRELAPLYPVFHSGLLRLTLAERYEMLANVPEFKALVAAVDRRHDDLATRF